MCCKINDSEQAVLVFFFLFCAPSFEAYYKHRDILLSCKVTVGNKFSCRKMAFDELPYQSHFGFNIHIVCYPFYKGIRYLFYCKATVVPYSLTMKLNSSQPIIAVLIQIYITMACRLTV